MLRDCQAAREWSPSVKIAKDIAWRPVVRAASVLALAAALGHPANAADERAAVGENTERLVHTADEALARLIEGNDRFMDGETAHLNQSAKRRIEVAKAQTPFATIFGCDDSRVPPEVIFDRGLGDLFVVRTAGHAVDGMVLGSLEFGAKELHIPLLVVMGHERCSAVKTALDLVASGRLAPGKMDRAVKGVRPAIVKTLDTKSNALDAAVRVNVELTVDRLRKAPLLAGLVAQGKLTIVGARYDLDTGGVEVIVP